jgi:hypothetical protein
MNYFLLNEPFLGNCVTRETNKDNIRRPHCLGYLNAPILPRQKLFHVQPRIGAIKPQPLKQQPNCWLVL